MTADNSSSASVGRPSRREIIRLAAAVSGSAALGLSVPDAAAAAGRGPDATRTLVGAIRWDAWVGGESHYGSGVNRTLSPDKYHFRLPFYADITVAQPTLIDQSFDGETTGAAPAGWNVTAPTGTDATVVEVSATTGKSARARSSSGAAATMARAFSAQERAVTVQWQWKETVAGQGSLASLRGGSSVAVDLATRVNGGAKELVHRATDGTWNVVQAVADDTWYSIKIIIDPAPPEAAAPFVDIFVDGIRKVRGATFREPTTVLDTLSFGTSEGTACELYIDDVSVRVTESVNSDAAHQSVMDQEIQYAKNAGIDYWAFVYYPQEPLARGRELYLAGEGRADVNWCAVLDGNFTGSYATNLPRLVAEFSGPTYQRVLGGRPLVYFFTTATADKVTQMRTACTRAGLPDPYIVVMAWTAQSAADLKTTVGADAVSRYATGEQNGAPYSQLADAEAGLWDQYAAAAGDVVPTVSTGWDKRTRYDYPLSWEPNYTGFKDEWTRQATPQEIATHLQGAVSWNNTHPDNASANTVLIYAWNEFDEGGWICPTLFEISDAGRPLRLDAIAKVPRTSSGTQR
ncbi:hypothetical protein GCM10009654_57000 [Streptomyces hebeiensis]|uniref:Uncharacterized protein n=1 Tax=Streptomyces hebeiensis TaxID=229486 RepID=A0ABN1V2V0_9ACTN